MSDVHGLTPVPQGPAGVARGALIVGAARGLGAALARALAADGWPLLLTFHRSAEPAHALAAELRARGARVELHALDAGDPRDCARVIEQARTTLPGGPSALLYCAGAFHRVDLLDETPERWRATFASNLDGLFHLARLCLPAMCARGWGRVLAFSLAGAEGAPARTRITAHHLAKGALVGLVRSLARRVAADGVTVNAIAPGFVDSGVPEQDELAALHASIPAGRVGTLDEVVALARFLLSDQAGYVTGANVPLSGGWGL